MVCDVAELGEFVCAVLGAISPFKTQVLQWWDVGLDALIRFGKFIQPHLQYIGPLFGFVMFVWRWWDKREEVLFRRLEALLQKKGKAIRGAGNAAIDVLEVPSIKLPNRVTVGLLQKIFTDTRLQPRVSLFPPRLRLFRQLDRMLQFAIKELDGLDRVSQLQAANRHEQRFAAYTIQGALAAARGKHADAVGFYGQAINVEGQKSHPRVLELLAQQNTLLGNKVTAAQQFDLAIRVLRGLLSSQIDLAERQTTNVQLVRAVRQRAQLHDKPSTANKVMCSILADQVLQSTFLNQSSISENALLERAIFHEVHGFIRMKEYPISPGNVTDVSLRNAANDYQTLIAQSESNEKLKPFGRIRGDKGSRRTRSIADDGFKRVTNLN